jgi:hypothetical protein
MHHFIYYAKLSAGSACARRRTAKGTYSTPKKFSELDGARNCIAGNDHMSRSDNQENNCLVSRITGALRVASTQSLKQNFTLCRDAVDLFFTKSSDQVQLFAEFSTRIKCLFFLEIASMRIFNYKRLFIQNYRYRKEKNTLD